MIIIEHLDGTINEILGDDTRTEEEKIKLYKSIFGKMIYHYIYIIINLIIIIMMHI